MNRAILMSDPPTMTGVMRVTGRDVGLWLTRLWIISKTPSRWLS